MFDETRVRRVVPRWRTSRLAAQTTEAWTTPPSTKPDVTDELQQKEKEFESRPSVPVAAELMFLGLSGQNEKTSRRAAQLILDNAKNIGATQLVVIAKKVLGAADAEAVATHGSDFIRHARKLLAIDYRNPVLLMDVARELTARRQPESARRYVQTALALAPRSRFILRSAARYYLHIEANDQAHAILRHSPLLAYDPWIRASEIAVATVLGRTSTITKQTLRILLEGKGLPQCITELASAVATIEFQHGSTKRAKQLFKQSLVLPNDNSLAQAEWAAARLGLVVDDTALRIPFSFEANANNAYRHLQVDTAIRFGEDWALDEPFASRPLDMLCYLHCITGHYDAAFDDAERALKVGNPNDLGLNLNLLFTRIQRGDLETAYHDLLQLAKHPDAKTYVPHMLANAGALAYMTGDIDVAHGYYQRAIQTARAKNDVQTEALARAYFARAAINANDPTGQSILDESATAVERLPNAGAIVIVRSLVDAKTKKTLEATALKRIAKRRWKWDAASNTLRALDDDKRK
jgi:hypothetical protein